MSFSVKLCFGHIAGDLTFESVDGCKAFFSPYSPQEYHPEFSAIETMATAKQKNFAMQDMRAGRKRRPDADVAQSVYSLREDLDPIHAARQNFSRRHVNVGGRKAQMPSAMIAMSDFSLDRIRIAQECVRLFQTAVR